MELSLRQFFIKNPLLCNKKIAVALSGGPDSVCLLYLLNEIKNEFSLTLSAAHLNHGIRGAEADRDEAFCVSLCKKLNIPITVKKVSVPSLKQKNESTELAARRIRYEFLENTEADFIATAHNKDDSAETFLFNLIRGTGVKGLTGIPVIRDRFVRPLLDFSKKDILEYLSANNIDYVLDSTNKQNKYSRNKIRNKVFPELEKINSAAKENIINLSEKLSVCDDFITLTATEYYNKAKLNGGIDVKKLQNLHSALIEKIIIMYFSENALSPDSNTVKAIESAVKNNENVKINYKKNIFAVIENGILTVVNSEKNDYFNIKIEKVNNLLLNNLIDCDKIKGEIIIGNKIPGDSLKLKNGHIKPLRKIISERKIPTYLRDRLPVIRDDEGVIFAYKVGTAERVLPDENTKNAVQIVVEELL